MERLKKREDETQFEYIIRITNGKKDKSLDIDYVEWSELVYGKSYSSDVARRMFYGVERFISVYEEEKELIHNIDDSEIIKKIEEKTKELKFEQVKVQDERRVNNRYIRATARHERLLDTLREELSKFEPLKINKVDKYRRGYTQASLLISDLHYGIECDNYWNVYNTDIANKRMMKLVEDVIYYCQCHDVSILHVELLGDLISGYIHRTLEIENEVDVIKQVIGCSELLAVCINRLADELDTVKVYITHGNHSRTKPNYKENVEIENFEYLIWEFLKLRVTRDDVVFHKSDIDETIIHYEIDGEHIFGTHGHLDKVNTVAQNFATMFNGTKIKAIHCGHLHHEYTNCHNGIKVIMNSTASGVDNHSKNMRYVGNPSQTLLIYHGENTININIEL